MKHASSTRAAPPFVEGSIRDEHIAQFQQIIWDYYRTHARFFAWRDTTNPYHIFVSEVMLQQTQADRVIPKYAAFIDAFPSFEQLARAPFADVLSQWSGLGYNRRALALHTSAKRVVEEFSGILPDDPNTLVTFPGIGPATAASITAFAFNRQTYFIETNVRTVFIYFFFNKHARVHDKEIMELVKKATPTDNPREWYYALMDYGVMLKKTLPNPSRKSSHHAVQSRFEGSNRQLRSKILHMILQSPDISLDDLLSAIPNKRERIIKNLEALQKEGMITQDKALYRIV